jgi:riboflavin kinase/FMN adenylyltransferase
MDLYRGIQTLNRALPHAVLTIGNFDGVHLGHQTIVKQAIEKARSRKGTAVAYTFRPHPQIALRPESQGTALLLSTYDEKLELLGALGLDVVVEEPFSREFSTTTPDQFFTDVILRRVSAEEIVVGYDFAFGKERSGHLEQLRNWCKSAGIQLTIVPPLKQGSDVVSSSRIRQYLVTGEVESAGRLLGREFFYRGVVIRGEGRGRKIGYPTANLKLENKIALPYGVYATWAILSSGERLPSVTNVGVRPTFAAPAGTAPANAGDELPVLVETYVLDKSFDLYGSTFEVRFVKRLRAEQKFSGIDALKAQIAKDVESARALLKP